MRISTYYSIRFDGEDFSNNIDWHDIVIEDTEKIDEIIIAAALCEDIEQLDCIQSLLGNEYNKVYNAELEKFKENSHNLNNNEDFIFNGEITMHIHTPIFEEDEIESCLRRLFEKEDYYTIILFGDAASKSFKKVNLIITISNLADEYNVGYALED